MNFMRTLIGINSFKSHHVTNHLIFLRDPVSTIHVARSAGDVLGQAPAGTLGMEIISRANRSTSNRFLSRRLPVHGQ